MVAAAKALRGVHSYAPAPGSYSYELLHTDDSVIFCVAVGQSTLLFRIPPDRRPSTVDLHDKPFPQLGSEWIAVPAFQPEIPLAEWRKTIRNLMKAAFNSAA
jgi:hypothetical protein